MWNYHIYLNAGFFFYLKSSFHLVEPLLLVGVNGFSPLKFGA